MFSFVHIDLTLLVLTPAVSNKLYFSRFDKRNTLILTNKSNFEHFPSTRTIFWRSKIEYQIPIGQTTGTRVDRSHGSNCMRACTNTMHTPKSENSVSHFEDTGPFYNYARTIKLLTFEWILNTGGSFAVSNVLEWSLVTWRQFFQSIKRIHVHRPLMLHLMWRMHMSRVLISSTFLDRCHFFLSWW